MENLYNLYTLHCISWQEGSPLLMEVRQAACRLGLLDASEVLPDDLDEQCRHALALSHSGHAVGCVRITEDGKIQRMAVLPESHREQLEKLLLETVLKEMLREQELERRTVGQIVSSPRKASKTRRLAA